MVWIRLVVFCRRIALPVINDMDKNRDPRQLWIKMMSTNTLECFFPHGVILIYIKFLVHSNLFGPIPTQPRFSSSAIPTHPWLFVNPCLHAICFFYFPSCKNDYKMCQLCKWIIEFVVILFSSVKHNLYNLSKPSKILF